jgi:uncharacterized membrane protein YoaK (UPF0700 family)
MERRRRSIAFDRRYAERRGSYAFGLPEIVSVLLLAFVGGAVDAELFFTTGILTANITGNVVLGVARIVVKIKGRPVFAPSLALIFFMVGAMVSALIAVVYLGFERHRTKKKSRQLPRPSQVGTDGPPIVVLDNDGPQRMHIVLVEMRVPANVIPAGMSHGQDSAQTAATERNSSLARMQPDILPEIEHNVSPSDAQWNGSHTESPMERTRPSALPVAPISTEELNRHAKQHLALILLALETILLLAVCGVGLGIQDKLLPQPGVFPNSDTLGICIIASVGGFAMGFHNGLVKELIPGNPSTSMQTGNILRLSSDIVHATFLCCLRRVHLCDLCRKYRTRNWPDRLPRLTGESEKHCAERLLRDEHRVGKNILRFGGIVVFFAFGCAIGVLLMIHIRFLSLLLPAGILMFLTMSQCWCILSNCA